MIGCSSSKWGKVCAAALAILLQCAGDRSAAAGTLWYNGDFDDNNAIVNGVDTAIGAGSQAYVYDDFHVPVGQIWLVEGVFSNDLLDFSPTSAYWEIRSGVSAGDGGNLIAFGTGAADTLATGRSGFGYDESTVTVSGLSVALGAGTYWLTVAPIGSTPGEGTSDVTTTSGANAIGTPPGNDGNAFVDGSYYVSMYGRFSPAGNVVLGMTGGIRISRWG